MKADTDSAPNPAVLRVFQSKVQTKAFYNKIGAVYETGFTIQKVLIKHMWIPVEIILAVKKE